MSRSLVELLFREKIINQVQLNEAVEFAKMGKSHLSYLIEKKYIAETKVLFFLSKRFSLPSINISKYEINSEVLKLVPLDLAKKVRAIPIQSQSGTLVVAIYDPTTIPSLENIKFVTKLSVEPVLTSYSAFSAAMSKYYGGVVYFGQAIETFKKEQRDSGEDVKNAESLELLQVHDIDSGADATDAPVIQLVNSVISEGLRAGASDIHVEPYEKRFRVRFRVDGTLQEFAQIPGEMKRAVIARFKIMSRMDISETRVPQDGRIKLKAFGKEVDFRINSMPTLYGEKIVLRVLSQGNLQLDLMKLGFEKEQLDVFKKGIESPNGLVLVTGPTGSGKTTTLYSALIELNKIQDNLSTAEDPVEYNLDGINQVQVHKEVGLTFANVLRALLRQDPDTILVGEIRDFETAEVAVQAALTGHLVLSTLHTNDAVGTITRLMNMGLEPFLVTASLNTVIAQRLLRTICSKCVGPDETFSIHQIEKANLDPAHFMDFKPLRGKGCRICNGSGYKGRIAIYETLDFTLDLKEMVLKGETIVAIKKKAIENGMKTLRLSAVSKFIEGKTTLEEALSSTMET